MTSSSDASAWRPLDLDGAFGGVAAPALEALPPAGGPRAVGAPSAGWLPSLQDDATRAAEDELHARVRAAYVRGREEAALDERARAEERCATALQAVAAAAGHLEAIASEFASDRERDLQALAIAVARHIVQRELTLDPTHVADLVRRALELLPLDSTLDVRVHPEDLRTLGAAVAGVTPEGRHVRLQWLPDPAVERGGFLIETPQRIVDGRTDVALRALYDRLDHE